MHGPRARERRTVRRSIYQLSLAWLDPGIIRFWMAPFRAV